MNCDNLRMFKAYDIRSKFDNIPQESIVRLSRAIALYYLNDVGTKSIVVARDARLHCPCLMEALIEAATDAGLDVFVNPVQISTCQFYFMCMQKRSSGGIMITASHNPGEYVGYKFVGMDVSPIASGCGPEGGIDRIKEYYIAKNAAPSTGKGRVRILQLQKEYVEYSMRLAGVGPGDLKGMKVYAEFLSGASGTDLAMAMDIAGAEFTPSHLVPDGFFPSGDPNPIIESSIAPSRERMKNGNYDIGFCFDGDGDRMDLMFPDGSQIVPGLNMSVLVPYVEEIFRPYFPGNYAFKCYVDVKAIPLALIEIAKTGIEPHIIRNGHSFIKKKLREHGEEGYIVSEEESAHYYMNFPFDIDDRTKGYASCENTLFFALLTARAMKENSEKYVRIHEIQRNIHRYREWPLHFDVPEKMEAIMEDVENAMASRGALVIKDMDDGSTLDATLMRFNLPAVFARDSSFPQSWCQVAQRISRSEDAMTRWEVVASDKELCDEYNGIIRSITDMYVKNGWAHY